MDRSANVARPKNGGSPARAFDAPDSVAAVLRSSGEPLDAPQRAALRSRFDHDFSGVRVHTDGAAATAAASIGARAFSSARHMVFGAGTGALLHGGGRRLFMHEAAHVAHADLIGSTQPGIAPLESRAEQRADGLECGPDAFVSRGDLRSWGPAWQYHRASIVTRGTSQSKGGIGLTPGVAGPPSGTIEVRTGEEIELAPGSRVPNVIALEYSGAVVTGSKWLQFAWFEMTALTPSGANRIAGNVNTSTGPRPFTTAPATPAWGVDSANATDPFYEAAGVSIRTASSTTMFDKPGGDSGIPLANSLFTSLPAGSSLLFTAHFATYLIQNNTAAYRVEYSASTAFARGAAAGQPATASAVGYSVGVCGPVAALDANHATILHTAYPTSSAVH